MLSIEVRKLIVAGYQDGMQAAEIARIFHCNKSTVYGLVEQWNKTGTLEYQYHNCGRKSAVSEEELEQIDALIQEQPDITLAEIKERLSLQVSLVTISNMIRFKLNYHIKKDASCHRMRTRSYRN